MNERPIRLTEFTETQTQWLGHPCIDLAYVANQLYGGYSRLHIRRLQDRIKGRVPLEPWEVEHLQRLRKSLQQYLAT